ncbi:MAG: hypothetical protein OXI81_15985 [Paracoccaceae bacterium]|nr:hypothetical protein [Paracoccaceae bacterium]
MTYTFGNDREVIAPCASALAKGYDEGLVGEGDEGNLEVMKLRSGLGIVPGKGQAGFGCHDALPFVESGISW